MGTKLRKPPSKGNVSKAITFAWAFNRMKEAIASGFHLEAITLAESIIADRLLSYVRGALKERQGRDLAKKAADQVTLGPLIASLDTNDVEPGVPLASLRAWKNERNALLHGIAKSEPGEPTQSIDDLLLRAGSVAAEGMRLSRAIDRWHRRERARHGRELQAFRPSSSKIDE